MAEAAVAIKNGPSAVRRIWDCDRASERRIVGVRIVVIGDLVLEQLTILVEQLHAVALPDGVPQAIDQLEDGEGLIWRPVGRDLDGEFAWKAIDGSGHDLALRRFCARCSDRSWASLRR